MFTVSAQGIWLPLLGFIASWWIACPALRAVPLQCTPGGIDEYAVVRNVIDGDTVVLADRRKVRLIGINAPEIGREGRRSQALAEPAREALKRLLTGQSRVGLKYDRQRRDRFGRQLNHLVLRDGTNVQAWLLERGLATALIFPPNLDHVECYRDAESAARRSNLGLWRLARYKPVDAGRVGGLSRGYRVVTGHVSGVRATRASQWLYFGPAFAVRIQRTDLPYFNRLDFHYWVGKRISVRGWLSRRNGKTYMRLSHPAQLDTIPG
ncbi:MAG: thermonuclease family protein [Gammaproteobacteria bacterium]